MKPKFKVGDKVTAHCNDFPTDDVGVVRQVFELDGKFKYYVKHNLTYQLRLDSKSLKVVETDFVWSEYFLQPYEKTKKVVLNKEHTAEVYKDKVMVGCQEFPISKIEEILLAAKSLK